ncbi:MAG: DUF3313 family protein [Pseudomonadota bacterium]
MHPSKARLTITTLLTIALGAITITATADDHENRTFDDLVPVENARVGVAYVDPEADFSVFGQVMLLEPYVAFKANWQRDQNRSRTNNVTARDMDRIRADVAALFMDVFREKLAEDGGFPIVEEGGMDVIAIRPAIIDLDVTAPDTRTGGRSRTFSSSTGSATLYIELVDTMTGATLGRALDRTEIRNFPGSVSWSNRVTNSADARRMMGRWADILRQFMDTHFMVKAE